MPAEPKCCNCGGEHAPEFLKCPVRMKETEVARIRAVQSVSYPEALRRVEEERCEAEEVMVVGVEMTFLVNTGIRTCCMLEGAQHKRRVSHRQ